MSYPVDTRSPLGTAILTSLDDLEGDTMFNPKWGVILVALAIFALAASYDAQLGLAVGIVLVVITAISLWIWARFALQPGESPADRSSLATRFKTLGRNRRAAQKAGAAAESSAQSRPDPRKRP